MKFMIGDYIRHVNGVRLFMVYDRNPKQGVYALQEDGSPVIHYYAACHIETMYRPIGVRHFPHDESSPMTKFHGFQKTAAPALGYGMKPDIFLDNFVSKIKFVPGRGWVPPDGESMVSKCSAVLDAPKVYAAQPLNPALPIGPDVTVSLPGIPAGYYLKAFRKALPGDLVLNTSGAVVPAKITKNWMTLYRPIVGKVSDIRKWSDPTSRIPGVPEEWTVIAYRKPKPGEQCLRLGSTEVFKCHPEDIFAQKNDYVIVQKIQRITPCDGTLPGIPKGYKLVGFGAVKEDQFFIDTVGTLKPGPAKHRLILEPLQVKQPDVVTEYEIRCYGASTWTEIRFYHLPPGINAWYTGRTRKVVVQ